MRHYNPTIASDVNRLLNLKSMEKIEEVSSQLVTVYPITRRCDYFVNGNVANSTGATIATTPSDKDVYLVGGTFSVIKDATSQSTLSQLTGVVDGVSRILANIVSLTLTAQSEVVSFSFETPIKLDRSSILRITHSNATANISGAAALVGYTMEVLK